ncbi:MAG: ArsR/SmtB family transcription factor [Lachnospirales bacterium]
MNNSINIEKNIKLSIDGNQREKLCNIGKALSSADRINIMDILRVRWMSIVEIAEILNIPVSSVAFHVKILEKAGLVITESKPGIRGTQRACFCGVQNININILRKETKPNSSLEIPMPVGSFYDFNVEATCGMANEVDNLILEDTPKLFYSPERHRAQIVWFRKGFLEYRFPNHFTEKLVPQRIEFSLELCSEVYGSNHDWPSYINVYINDFLVGTYLSPGDFGDRRGVYTPDYWCIGSTQYGLLKHFSVDRNGSYIDHTKTSEVTIDHIDIFSKNYISFKIEVDENKMPGGINIFGKKFGDYPQDIIMKIEY